MNQEKIKNYIHKISTDIHNLACEIEALQLNIRNTKVGWIFEFNKYPEKETEGKLASYKDLLEHQWVLNRIEDKEYLFLREGIFYIKGNKIWVYKVLEEIPLNKNNKNLLGGEEEDQEIDPEIVLQHIESESSREILRFAISRMYENGSIVGIDPVILDLHSYVLFHAFTKENPNIEDIYIYKEGEI